jgi:hypothetical protein
MSSIKPELNSNIESRLPCSKNETMLSFHSPHTRWLVEERQGRSTIFAHKTSSAGWDCEYKY